MNQLANKNLEVTLFSLDGDVEFGMGYASIKETNLILTVKGNVKLPGLRAVIARLENNNILILLEGKEVSFVSSSIQFRKKYAFFETLYPDSYPFEDKYKSVKCSIPLLNSWFFSKYYSSDANDTETVIKIQNERAFEFKHGRFAISLYYQARLNFGQAIKVKPVTDIVIECEEKIERYELINILNIVKQFFQTFFFDRFKAYNLSFINNNNQTFSHSRKYWYKEELDLPNHPTVFLSFESVKEQISILFEKWYENVEENLTIEDLFEDAFTNPASVNRFLSAMRVLEILSKRIIDSDIESEVLKRKQKIKKEQILRSGEKPFSQYWILKPFALYSGVLPDIPDSEVVDIINNRNFYTHRGYKIKGVVNIHSLHKLTSKVLGISKTVFFLQLGLKRKELGYLMSFFNFNYTVDPIDNENSSFFEKE